MLKTINSGTKGETTVNEDHCRHARSWIDKGDGVFQAYCETCREEKQTFKETYFNQAIMNNTTRCECGEIKPAQYNTCYKCLTKKLKPDEKCHCGKPKKANFPECYKCSHNLKIPHEI